MGKGVLAGLTFLLSMGCSQPTEPAEPPDIINKPDTVHVVNDTTYISLPDYSFTFGIVSKTYTQDSWGIITFGELFNDSDTNIVGLRPNLKLYRGAEDREENNWFLNNYGYLGTSIMEDTLGKFVLADTTDTLNVGSDLYHLIHSDSISADKIDIYWRFKFDMNGTMQKSLEGRLKEKAEE